VAINRFTIDSMKKYCAESWGTLIHESAHVFVAIAAGFKIQAVDLDRTEKGVIGSGSVFVDRGDRRSPIDAFAFSVSGIAASGRDASDWMERSQTDLDAASGDLSRMIGMPASFFLSDHRRIFTDPTGAKIFSFVETFLQLERAALECFASSLFGHDSMSGEMAERLVHEALHDAGRHSLHGYWAMRPTSSELGLSKWAR
jgi:hypothetical protein